MIWFILVFIAAAVVVAPVFIESQRFEMDRNIRGDAAGKFAQLSQGITHYEWLGPVRGPIAVCIHGLTTPSFIWRGLARGLALLGYRVLIYDLYGRGYSDRVPGAQDREFFLQQLVDLLADQDVEEDITLIGYSMGGAIATAFTSVFPDRVRQLVLLAPAGIEFKTDPATRFMQRVPVLGDWLMLAVFPRRFRASTEADRDLPSSIENVVELQQRELKFRGFTPAVLASMRGMLSEVQKDEHRAIQKAGVPVLAIWGGEDSVIPLSSMSKLAQWSRNAKHEVIDGAGHGLLYTHTDAVLDAMREALRDGLY